jgi:hypothetical protein
MKTMEGAKVWRSPGGAECQEQRDERVQHDQRLEMKMNGEPCGKSRQPDDEWRVGFDQARTVELGAVEDAGGGIEEPCLILTLPSEKEDGVEGDVKQESDDCAKENEPQKLKARRVRGAGVQESEPRRACIELSVWGGGVSDTTNLPFGGKAKGVSG